MSNIEFESDYNSIKEKKREYDSNIQAPTAKGLIGWMINKGLVKNQEAAKSILLAIIILNFSIIGLIIYNSFGGSVSNSPSPNRQFARPTNYGFRLHHPQ
jgi:hypothetical protein